MPTRSWLLSVVEGAVSSAGSFASCAGGVVPAPQGEIAVRIENGEIAYHLPVGVEGELALKDRTLIISGDGCEKL